MASCTFDDGPCFLTDINGQDTMDWRKAAVSLILYFVCNFIAFAIFFFYKIMNRCNLLIVFIYVLLLHTVELSVAYWIVVMNEFLCLKHFWSGMTFQSRSDWVFVLFCIQQWPTLNTFTGPSKPLDGFFAYIEASVGLKPGDNAIFSSATTSQLSLSGI